MNIDKLQQNNLTIDLDIGKAIEYTINSAGNAYIFIKSVKKSFKINKDLLPVLNWTNVQRLYVSSVYMYTVHQLIKMVEAGETTTKIICTNRNTGVSRTLPIDIAVFLPDDTFSFSVNEISTIWIRL